MRTQPNTTIQHFDTTYVKQNYQAMIVISINQFVDKRTRLRAIKKVCYPWAPLAYTRMSPEFEHSVSCDAFCKTMSRLSAKSTCESVIMLCYS